MRKQNSQSGSKRPATSYKDAGVDLKLYAKAMKRIPRLMHPTWSPRVLPNDGGFAGLFQLDAGSGWKKRNYRDPVLVSGTDGVGSKIQVAQMADRHDSIGIDLVAMCVNDVICCGAEPLFFLDYVAMSHDDPRRLEQIVAGIARGCREAGSALLGGETAIMPDTYRRGDYDLAGFQVGVVERRKLIDGSAVAPGDVAIGLASTGLHSNGFGLVRKIVFEMAGFAVSDVVAGLDAPVGDLLLTPTRIYATAVGELLKHRATRSAIHGIAHITGGGIQENLQRILPANVDVVLEGSSWKIPPVFPWLMKLGNVRPAEMYRVFNMGLGMILVVDAQRATHTGKILGDAGFGHWLVGEVVAGGGRVRIRSRKTRSVCVEPSTAGG